MDFNRPLIQGHLVRRYQRFLADIDVDGELVTVHCPNPGAMLGLNKPRARVWISEASNQKRRLKYTLEIIEAENEAGTPIAVGINTGLPNRLVEDAIRNGVIGALSAYEAIRREVRYGDSSRIDLLLEKNDCAPCYVEVKNVHLRRTPGLAEFPDCVTARGAKHLRELSAMASTGARAVMVFCVQRADVIRFALASDIDPAYAKAFRDACEAGVETLVYRCHVAPEAIEIRTAIPFEP